MNRRRRTLIFLYVPPTLAVLGVLLAVLAGNRSLCLVVISSYGWLTIGARMNEWVVEDDDDNSEPDDDGE